MRRCTRCATRISPMSFTAVRVAFRNTNMSCRKSCVSMLSGPQTVGEIRTRGSRMYEFSGLEEVEETLRALSTHEGEPLVTKLPRQPGQKEARFAHLLSGEPEVEEIAETFAP